MTDFDLRGDDRRFITHIRNVQGLHENFGFYVSTHIKKGVITTDISLVCFKDNNVPNRYTDWFCCTYGYQYTGRMTTPRMKQHHSKNIDQYNYLNQAALFHLVRHQSFLYLQV